MCILFGSVQFQIRARRDRKVGTGNPAGTEQSRVMAQQQRDKRWISPDPEKRLGHGLRVNNTLSGTKVPFITKDGTRNVSWYNCGPTVYDSSHVGHARNYLTFDIIRRILEDYFKYNVFYVMNITDVDDKIINRARRNHLLDRYRQASSDPEKVYGELEAAFEAEISKQNKNVIETQKGLVNSTSSQQKKDLEEKLQQEKLKLSNVEKGKASIAEKVKEATSLGGRAGVDFLLSDSAADALASQIDSQKGHEVTDHTIFRAHASRYEREFFEDMESLGVRPPRAVTRVTEYIDVIIKYVERIIKQGFAYQANGSVYFDTKAFIDSGHTYGKLNPWAVGSAGLASESEANFESGEKKNVSDFALWKLSKKGEPFWESPWGLGRPGWHIECSAMASDIIGETLDLHSGGNDLMFPHHDNELAQAEAFHNCSQWVNYFLHSGHLAINGLKMSKSLKNFITIKQALSRYSARQLRLLFVSNSWDKPMTFSDAAMETTITREKKLDAFFDNVKGIIRQSDLDDNARWTEDERDLNAKFKEADLQVREHLEDNFDTAGALEDLLNLVKDVKQYSDKKVQSKDTVKVGLVKDVAIYVTEILAVFGLSNAAGGEFGWGRDSSVGAVQSSKEDLVAPYLDAIVSLKEDMRGAALKLPQGPSKEEFLALGDNFRDITMLELGVRLEDRVPGTSDAAWKLVDPDVLRGERDEKIKKAKEEKLSKLESQRDRQMKELAKWETAEKDPRELFRGRTHEFSAFDSDGMPTHDNEGRELTKSTLKKLRKEMEQAKKQNETFQQKLTTNPQFLEAIKIVLRDVEDKLADLKTS